MANICHLAHVFFINLVRKTSHLKLMVSVYEPNGRPGWTLYLGFSSMKRLGVFLSPPPRPGWYLFTLGGRGNGRAKCLIQEHNTMFPSIRRRAHQPWGHGPRCLRLLQKDNTINLITFLLSQLSFSFQGNFSWLALSFERLLASEQAPGEPEQSLGPAHSNFIFRPRLEPVRRIISYISIGGC